jgi:hypothetical protein
VSIISLSNKVNEGFLKGFSGFFVFKAGKLSKQKRRRRFAEGIIQSLLSQVMLLTDSEASFN